MKRKYFAGILMIGVVLFCSCNTTGEQKKAAGKTAQNTILQQKDGTISLKVDKAECYHDVVNPSSNTAEWNFVVSKSGRYNVWMSSATKDTTNLQYNNKVMLSLLDNRLEVKPGCDKIVHNSSDVSYPYFRADSFVGSLYIQDTGLYYIQVISEKILPDDSKNDKSSSTDNTKFLSVFLTPITN
jgi:hypothetical protein